MTEAADQNIRRYSVGIFPYLPVERENRFCLLGVLGYESNDPALRTKRDHLLATLAGNHGRLMKELECTIGGCTTRVTEDARSGTREVTGDCTATSYCLKQTFEAVGEADDREEGKRLYKEIMSTCEGRASSQSAGNFCPRTACGLSAGVSIDGPSGTDGECYVEIRSPQGVIPFEESA